MDEVQYVRQGASMGTHGLEPTGWGNPPLFKYLLFGEYGVLFLVGKLLGWYRSTAEFGAANTLDPTALYLLGRGTSALLGAATIAVVFVIAEVAYNRRVGLLAAWFLATAFFHVRESHFAVNDVATTFLVTLTMLFAILIAVEGKIRWYVLAGITLGLGFATKYSAIFTLVPIVVAHFVSPSASQSRLAKPNLSRLIVSPAVAGLTAVIVSPYFILRPGNVIHDTYQGLYLAAQQGFDGWQIDSAGGYVFYARTLIWGLGWGLCFLTLAGWALALWRHSPGDVVLLSLPVTFYLLLGRQQMYFARFILPCVPIILVLAARSLDVVCARVLPERRTQAAVVAGIAMLVTSQPLANSIRFDYLMTQTDTRTLAKQWIEDNLPAGARIAVDWPFYGPPLATNDKLQPASERTFNVTVLGGEGLSQHPLSWYREQGYDYLVVSSFIADIPVLDAERNRIRQRFYAPLASDLGLVQQLRPSSSLSLGTWVFDEVYGPAVSLWQRERPGPTITVYRLP
ncbi:MAG: glycosyltransferase family 39 protein [Anaerolineae bacterium]